MTRTDAILWAGRVLSAAFTASIVYDALADGMLSDEIRRATLATAGLLFLALCLWQVRIAWRYDGPPVRLPLPFRWVMAAWLGSLALLVAWRLLVGAAPGVYTAYRAAVVWWCVGQATIYFAARWTTVETPHRAGIGETGTGPGGA